MSKFDFRTPLIYVLVGVILILLVLMSKMDEGNKEQTLEKRIEQLAVSYTHLTLPTIALV